MRMIVAIFSRRASAFAAFRAVVVRLVSSDPVCRFIGVIIAFYFLSE